jgi:hypothetical protein
LDYHLTRGNLPGFPFKNLDASKVLFPRMDDTDFREILDPPIVKLFHQMFSRIGNFEKIICDNFPFENTIKCMILGYCSEKTQLRNPIYRKKVLCKIEPIINFLQENPLFLFVLVRELMIHVVESDSSMHAVMRMVMDWSNFSSEYKHIARKKVIPCILSYKKDDSLLALVRQLENKFPRCKLPSVPKQELILVDLPRYIAQQQAHLLRISNLSPQTFTVCLQQKCLSTSVIGTSKQNNIYSRNYFGTFQRQRDKRHKSTKYRVSDMELLCREKQCPNPETCVTFDLEGKVISTRDGTYEKCTNCNKSTRRMKIAWTNVYYSCCQECLEIIDLKQPLEKQKTLIDRGFQRHRGFRLFTL